MGSGVFVDVGVGVSVGVGEGVIVGVEVGVAVGVEVAVGVGVRVCFATWTCAIESCLPLVNAREKEGDPNQIINPNISMPDTIAKGARIGRLRTMDSVLIALATRGRDGAIGWVAGVELIRKR